MSFINHFPLAEKDKIIKFGQSSGYQQKNNRKKLEV
jgi:hypothetical protein